MQAVWDGCARDLLLLRCSEGVAVYLVNVIPWQRCAMAVAEKYQQIASYRRIFPAASFGMLTIVCELY